MLRQHKLIMHYILLDIHVVSTLCTSNIHYSMLLYFASIFHYFCSLLQFFTIFVLYFNFSLFLFFTSIFHYSCISLVPVTSHCSLLYLCASNEHYLVL